MATEKWLAHHEPATVAVAGGDLLAAAAQSVDTEDAPEAPEPLIWLRRSRLLSAPLIEGSLLSWPFVLLREIETVTRAEHEHSQLREANLIAQMEAKANAK